LGEPLSLPAPHQVEDVAASHQFLHDAPRWTPSSSSHRSSAPSRGQQPQS
jgi:hypothetical protein